MNKTGTGLLLLCLLAGGCKAASDSDRLQNTCDAGRWNHLVGKDGASAAQVPDPKRVIPPNSMVTQDYREDRTNLDLDAAGTITRIWCG